jgi:hypothetical protein
MRSWMRNARDQGPPQAFRFWIVVRGAAATRIGPLATLGDAIDEGRRSGGGASIYLGTEDGPDLGRYVMTLSDSPRSPDQDENR